MSVTSDFSGIVLNQNASATASLGWRAAPFNAQTIYQTFYLPHNYAEGTTEIEQRYPDLSGFQVFVNIDAGYAQAATLDYTLDYYVISEGWNSLTSGTAIGCHSDGAAWFDIVFTDSVPVTPSIATSLIRIGVTGRMTRNATLNAPVTTNPDGSYVVEGTRVAATLREGVPYPVSIGTEQGFLLLTNGEVTYSVQQGINGLWYVNPTPLIPPSCEAFLSDSKTPLFTGSTVALNFRILALTADGGTDFLGNNYRSCVVQNTGQASSLQNAAVTATNSTTWISKPQPSPFAVVSQYWDVRPAPTLPGYSAINLLPNGSFEFDGLGTTPYSWNTSPITGGLVPRVFAIENGWSAFGQNALRWTTQYTTATPNFTSAYVAGIPVSGGVTYHMGAIVNVFSMPPLGGIEFNIWWQNTLGQWYQVTPVGTSANLGIHTITATATAPATSVQAYFWISHAMASSVNALLDFYVDGIYFGTDIDGYFDGNTPGGYIWMGQPGRSPSAKENPVTAQDTAVVLDGVSVTPSTPNVSMNVYYSVDDAHQSDNMTEEDWEEKLWVHIPETYVLTAQQQCVFPAPVHAKYIKLEYTNPQAQSYDPGIFNQPMTYKKFPTWVAEYFIAQMESASFLATSASVANDALNFAYAYYLDDLHELPANPIPAPPDAVTTLTNYFNRNSVADQVDTTTLAQISFVMNQFQLPTGTLLGGANSSLIEQYASNIINANQLAPTSEVPSVGPIDYSAVSTLNREPVVLEQGMPVMFFFVTCRHTYKEVSASFEYNRAYFVGIQDVSFLRANYTTSTDTAQYIETGGDTRNADVMDWQVDSDLNWYTY